MREEWWIVAPSSLWSAQVVAVAWLVVEVVAEEVAAQVVAQVA